MSKIIVTDSEIIVDNNGHDLIYDIGLDTLKLPVTVNGEGEALWMEIPYGRNFLVSCTAIYGCFAVKAMEE